MDRLGILVAGELDRLKKYNLFTALTVVLLMWLAIAWLLDAEELKLFVPLILLMDSTMMTIVLVGATLFYEKKEHTLNSILVSPVREAEYLISKIIVGIINSLITLVALWAMVYFLKDISFNFLLVAGAIIVIAAFHTLLGIWFSYYAKNFSSLLVNFMIYVLVLAMPSVLAVLDIIGPRAARFLIVLPPEASLILLQAGFQEEKLWKIIFSFVYLVALSLAIYKFVVRPKLNEYAMRETGV